MHLYHFTDQRSAEAIVREGFEGESCWLSPDVESVFGEASRSALLSLDLALTAEELSPSARRIKATEVWDDRAEAFVPAEDFGPTAVWYELPTELVRTFGRVRFVSRQERRRLMLGDVNVEPK